jgi:hypothetical protein
LGIIGLPIVALCSFMFFPSFGTIESWRPHMFPGRTPRPYPGHKPIILGDGFSNTMPIGSMYGIYANIYHQYTPNVSIYTIHGSYGM